MVEFDKIKILWIEDLPGKSHPPRVLGKFAKYFEIITKDAKGKNTSIRSIDEYYEIRDNHLSNKIPTTNNSPLPVEIVAADYDLSKYTPGSNEVSKTNYADEDPEAQEDDTDNPDLASNLTEPEENWEDIENPNYDDFDGCVINTMYLSEFHDHPTGSIITTYQDPKKRHRYAKILESHLKRLHHIQPMFSEGQRTWDNIITSGVFCLRDRLKELTGTGKIIISPDDLIELAEKGTQHETLTFHTPGASRCIPIRGLFCDYWETENKLEEKIKEFAESLLQQRITRDTFNNAKSLTNAVWEAYNNDKWMQEYASFSRMHTNGQHDTKEYQKLYGKFKPEIQQNKGKNKGSTIVLKAYCRDIRWGDKKTYSKEVRRWTALFLIRKLLKRILLFQQQVTVPACSAAGIEDNISFYSEIDVDDLLLLLFPVPESPFPAPWHLEDSKLRSNKKGGWGKYLKSLNIDLAKILNGECLRQGERLVLQGLVMDEDLELGSTPAQRLATWKDYSPANLFLFGSNKVIAGEHNE